MTCLFLWCTAWSAVTKVFFIWLLILLVLFYSICLNIIITFGASMYILWSTLLLLLFFIKALFSAFPSGVSLTPREEKRTICSDNPLSSTHQIVHNQTMRWREIGGREEQQVVHRKKQLRGEQKGGKGMIKSKGNKWKFTLIMLFWGRLMYQFKQLIIIIIMSCSCCCYCKHKNFMSIIMWDFTASKYCVNLSALRDTLE